ncbi:hypothetical protein Asppvi_008021 [Aspergillus pseudoviridinutans]|uniref:Uncharacterized protein n=1 Tax=Aspergillus pseudoviridinutans TaxID=1517512 RepID=A0A9P3EX12_9EURO|nr:uncharacterized protein Asppvi_008021 [Aspergillus pseudoviridinutans]GIJ89092.1 hypothetical protein Asppvi_008021 [Aspergillus pseudoviridinutans]
MADQEDESMASSSSQGVNLSQILKTPEPFDIDNLEDVNRELNRLEDLAAEHHGMNASERFRTRFERLENQRDQLRAQRNPSDSMDRDSVSSESFFDAPEMLEPDQQTKKGKRRQVSRIATMPLDPNAATKILTDKDIIQIAQQPPAFRKRYTRYWNSDGKIKEPYFRVIFQQDDAGNFLVPEEYLASNIERWRSRLAQLQHPEWYNCRGALRKRAIKARKDQRIGNGRFVKNEIDELNDSTRARAIAAALRDESVLGLQTRNPPTTTATRRVEAAENEALRFKALLHDSDAIHRDEVMETERRHRKALRDKEKEIDILKRHVADLESKIEALNITIERQNKIIDRLTSQEN